MVAFEFDLLVLIRRVGQLHHEVVDCRSEISQPPVDLIGHLAHGEIDAKLLLLLVLVLFVLTLFVLLPLVLVLFVFALLMLALFVLVVVMFLFFVMVMAVEFASEGHPVLGVVGANADADEASLAKPAKAAIAILGPGPGILDCSCGRVVVSGANAIPPAPDPPGAAGVVEAGRPSRQGVARAGGALDVALHAVRMRDEARMAANGVHDASHGVAAVEQGCGALHHFEPVKRQRIERLGVVAGVGRDGTRPQPVGHDQNPVAVEAANDRA